MTAKNIIESIKEFGLLAGLSRREKPGPVRHVLKSERLSIQEEDVRSMVGEVYLEVEWVVRLTRECRGGTDKPCTSCQP